MKIDWLDQELSACATALIEESVRKFGEARIRVTGSSMFPAIRPGDFVTVHRLEPAQVSIGEVVLFIREHRLILHRALGWKLSAEGGRTMITRGDSLPYPDPPVSPDELLGCVTAIRRGRRLLTPRSEVSRLAWMISSTLRRFNWPAKGLLGLYGLWARLVGREVS
jgi:signal peptidase I